jgi:hypothetical protein
MEAWTVTIFQCLQLKGLGALEQNNTGWTTETETARQSVPSLFLVVYFQRSKPGN